VYMIDKTESFRQAVVRALANLNNYYSSRSYNWGGSDDYADSIEGAINLYNREPIPSVAQWMDSEIKVMWNMQKADGVIEGWHGDGNFARTTIMYCLWKTMGLTVSPWREDVVFGAVYDKEGLRISVSCDRGWDGKLIFDTPRHRTIMRLPLDWPRINQFPEWFTVESQRRYMVHDLTYNSKTAYTGKQLAEGIDIHVAPNAEKYLLVE